jgi:hypothetical protein
MDDCDREYDRHCGGSGWHICICQFAVAHVQSRANRFRRAPAHHDFFHALTIHACVSVCSTALLPGWTHTALVSSSAVSNDHRQQPGEAVVADGVAD